jgi:hypothetical protein
VFGILTFCEQRTRPRGSWQVGFLHSHAIMQITLSSVNLWTWNKVDCSGALSNNTLLQSHLHHFRQSPNVFHTSKNVCTLVKNNFRLFVLSEDISYFYIWLFLSSWNKQTFYIESGLHCLWWFCPFQLITIKETLLSLHIWLTFLSLGTESRLIKSPCCLSMCSVCLCPYPTSVCVVCVCARTLPQYV